MVLALVLSGNPAHARDGVHTFEGTPREERMDLIAEAMAIASLCPSLRINKSVLDRENARWKIKTKPATSDQEFLKERKRSYRAALSRYGQQMQCITGSAFYGDDGVFIPNLLIEE